MFNNNTKKFHKTFNFLFYFKRNKIAENVAWKNIP